MVSWIRRRTSSDTDRLPDRAYETVLGATPAARATSMFRAQVAKASDGTGTIEVRLDSPTGPLLGAVSVDSTGDVYTYATATGALSGAAGVRDVYLVLSDDVRLASFSLQ